MSANKNDFLTIESIRLDAELLLADFLFENDVISESAYKVDYVGSSSKLLFENASRQNSPGYFYNKVHYVDFRNVWNNVKDYPTVEDVYRVFHPSSGSIATNTATNWVGRVLKKFLGEGNDPGVPEARKELVAKSTRERGEIEKKMRAGEIDEYEDEFGTMSIDGGYQRKSSRSGNLERASTLFPGEVYSDHTRIPPRRWGSWWKRFLRRKTSVANPESSILAMRKWTKHFIMGYQINSNLFFEIWYNSENSTFSVHDKNGNLVRQGGEIPLMRDAMNVLFHNVADASPMDAQVLNMRSPDLRKVNQDIARALNGQVDAAQSQAERMRERKNKIIELQKQEEERRREDAERRDRAAADARGSHERSQEEETDKSIAKSVKDAAKDAAKNQMKKAVEKGIKNYKQASAERFAKDKEGTKPLSPEEEIANRRKSRQADAESRVRAEERSSDRREQEKNQRSEEARLKAENDLKDEIRQAEEELRQIRNNADDAGVQSEIERKALQQELENELKDMRDAADEIDNGDFDKKLQSELEKIKRRSAKRSVKKRQRKEKSATDGDDMATYDRKLRGGEGRAVNEAEDFDPFGITTSGKPSLDDGEDLSDYEYNPLYQTRANQEVVGTRQKAESSSYTRQLINNMFIEGFVQMYEKTRVRDNRTFVRRIFDRLKLFRGRVDKIALPTRVVSSYMRTKGFFAGVQARADFIIGYTINDVANFEIWYVQEISGDGKSQVSSFYLYDVTAMKVIEGGIPHYRNAIQMLLLKIGSEDTKGA